MFKVNNKDTKRRSGVFIIDFEHISHPVPVFLLLTFLPVRQGFKYTSGLIIEKGKNWEQRKSWQGWLIPLYTLFIVGIKNFIHGFLKNLSILRITIDLKRKKSQKLRSRLIFSKYLFCIKTESIGHLRLRSHFYSYVSV